MAKYSFKYIDLFAGIGGFHQAMSSLGGECTFASEIDNDCVELYKSNYHFKKVFGDIRKVDPVKDIEPFDVLCAGFPCQSFSKAGLRLGFDDATRGDLFDYIIKILDVHKEVKFIFLENVKNLADNEENWKHIQSELMKENFFITDDPLILSPSDFGIPQIRERVYILGIRKDLRNIERLPNGFIHIEDLNLNRRFKTCSPNCALEFINNNLQENEIVFLSDEENEVLEAWDNFREHCLIESINAPVWLPFFGIGFDDNEEFFTQCNFYLPKEDPDYCPNWKQHFIKNNRNLYVNNREWIDNWINEFHMLERKRVYQKFEWNCRGVCENIREGIIQFRQSGIRVKTPNTFPSLVAMVNTPCFWDPRFNAFRYLTVGECAKLQSFSKSFKFSDDDRISFKQLGNSVNVKILKILGKSLFSLAVNDWEEK